MVKMLEPPSLVLPLMIKEMHTLVVLMPSFTSGTVTLVLAHTLNMERVSLEPFSGKMARSTQEARMVESSLSMRNLCNLLVAMTSTVF